MTVDLLEQRTQEKQLIDDLKEILPKFADTYPKRIRIFTDEVLLPIHALSATLQSQIDQKTGRKGLEYVPFEQPNTANALIAARDLLLQDTSGSHAVIRSNLDSLIAQYHLKKIRIPGEKRLAEKPW